MVNPILSAMNLSGNNNLMQAINMAKSVLSGKSPEAVFQMMMQNPQFRNFVNANRGKTPEQIASENGIDINQIINMMK